MSPQVPRALPREFNWIIHVSQIIKCGDKYMDLSTPLVMGILNLTPQSFCSVGRKDTFEAALRHGVALASAGAAIIDVGAEPTNSSQKDPQISLEQELEKLIPVVRALSKEVDIPISVDTSKPEVMDAAVAEGASFINDVRALRLPGALEMAARLKVPVSLMHMKYPFGKPEIIPAQNLSSILQEVKTFLRERIQACEEAGISSDQIILDPGIGAGHFGKSREENLLLLKELKTFLDFNKPLLVGLSRKTFLDESFQKPVEDRLFEGIGAAVMAYRNGAMIFRTHDVPQTLDALRVAQAILDIGENSP